MSTCTMLLFLVGVLAVGCDAGTNCTPEDAYKNCKDGMLFPLWMPFRNIGVGDRIGRAVVYAIAVVYIFLGISIVADRFMSSIEVITSKERNVTVKRPDGQTFTVTVKIWNETVSNLTLMALGSSAPEILLAIIEIVGHDFKPGELGPNTIVGSAAFNLFMIIAICVFAVPSTEIRRQKHLNVFFVTATWSVFAYIWLYLILAQISPGVVDIWEGLLTFLFFPLTVLTAYIADTNMIQTKFMPKRYRQTARGLVTTEEGEMELKAVGDVHYNNMGMTTVVRQQGVGISAEDPYRLAVFQPGRQESTDPAVKAFEETRREFMEIMREIRKQNPNIEPEALQKQAEYQMINNGPKSRAFYRVQATRKLMGGGDLVKKGIEKKHQKELKVLEKKEQEVLRNTCRIFLDPAHYTVLENIGTFDVVVTREGGPPNLTIMLDYATEDGSANAGSDYMAKEGTLTFYPETKHHRIPIEIVDDDIFEEDEHFYLHLTNLRVRTKDGIVIDPSKVGGVPVAELDVPPTATIMILDDDHAGVFSFENAEYEVIESSGYLRLKVMRHSGARGKVLIPYKTGDGSAKHSLDYEGKEGQLTFDNDDTEAYIEIGIVDKEEYERTDHFFVELGDPIWSKKQSDMSKVQERYKNRMLRRRSLGLDEKAKEAAAAEREGADGDGSSSIVPKFFRDRVGSWLTGKGEGDADRSSDAGSQTAKELTEEEKIADLGKPRLGDCVRTKIIIKESKEFQGVVDKLLKTANTSLVVGTSSWREQFVEALTVSAGDEDDEEGDDEEKETGEGEGGPPDGEEKGPSWADYVMHFIAVPWKLVFALIPPTDYFGGWACFVVSIMGIGFLTAMVGDLAGQFGCWVGLKDAVTAITFVALGTSVPDTFASKVAAIQDKYADSSIGNVTGSNGVNVFLGIGIAWTIAAVYHNLNGRPFEVSAGTLAFSVTIFCVEALIAIGVILLRRHPSIGGELGGPMGPKVATSLFLASLWVTYIVLSTLESYCVIAGF